MDIRYLTYPLNGLLMIGLGVGLGLALTRRFRLGWSLWLIGCATFLLSQLGHLPFNLALLNPALDPWLDPHAVLPWWKPPLAMLLLGLSAGVFEEVARYAMFRWWARDARSWEQGLLAGAGHGGMEAILLGVLVLLTFVNLSAARHADLAALVPAEELSLAQAQVEAYWSAPWPLTLMGALERLFTLPFHLAASLLVMQAFLRRGGLGWLGLAILWHALINAGVVFAAIQGGPYLAEGLLGLLALLNLGLIFWLRRSSPQPPNPPPPIPQSPNHQPLHPPSSTPQPLHPEDLEQTRYQG